MKDLENLKNALAIHAITGLPLYQWEVEYADGRIEAGRVVVKHGEALIDRIAPDAWYWEGARPSSLGLDEPIGADQFMGVNQPKGVDQANVLLLRAIEKPRVTVMFTGSGGNVFDIERRVDALRRDPQIGEWLNTHSGLPLQTAIADHKLSSAKALIEGGTYPHAYDFLAIQHAILKMDCDFLDWIFKTHPVESSILDKKIVFNLQVVFEDASTGEKRLLGLIDALSRHQRLPGLWTTVVRDVVRNFSPAVLEALVKGGALHTLEGQHGDLIRTALMKVVCSEISDRYIEVLLDAGVEVAGFARAESLRDQRKMEDALNSSSKVSRPAISRKRS